MNEKRAWPSRRLQIIVIIILALGAALQVFVPPINREKHARQLYEDHWFKAVFSTRNMGSDWSDIRELEKVISLSPGNTFYEQALVSAYPKDKLLELLKERPLTPEAKGLGYSLMDMPGQSDSYMTFGHNREKEIDPVLMKQSMDKLDDLIARDPDNAFPHYEKAYILRTVGRMEEALAEVKSGNRAGHAQFYSIRVSKDLRKTIIGLVVRSMDDHFAQFARYRELARGMSDLASSRLRNGKMREACEPLEECCHMGMVVATSTPHQVVPILVGSAIYAIGYRDLDPLCRDHGMPEKLAAYRSISEEFAGARDLLKDSIDEASPGTGLEDSGMDSVASSPGDLLALVVPAAFFPCSLPAAICGGLGLTIIGLVLVLLQIIIWYFIRRKRKEQALVLSAWEEGRLARLFMILYLPALVLATTVLIASHTVPKMYKYALYSDMAAPALTAVAFIISTALLIRALRRRYNENADRRVGVFRFLFGSPASMQVWKLKHFSTALLSQLLFFACLFLLLTAIYKPLFGFHPWQAAARVHITWDGHESETTDRLCARLEQVSPWKK